LAVSERSGLPPRPDKWYLGMGDGLLWAPPFPRWLEWPGFWDEAHLFQYPVGPLVTLSFVRSGKALTPRARCRQWTPAALTLDYTLDGLPARERRAATGGAFISEWLITNPRRRPVALDVVAWTAVPGEALATSDVRVAANGLQFIRTVADRHGHDARVAMSLTLSPAAQSHGGYRSERSAPDVPPWFELTPFADRWEDDGRLRDELRLDGLDDSGVVYLGLQRRIRLGARGTARVSAGVGLALASTNGGIPSRSRMRPVTAAVRAWQTYFRSLPALRSSDPFIERHWWHRWYGLKLNAIAGGVGNYRHPTVCEGIAYFHVPITYSAQCHLRELRWFPDPTWARGVVRTFLEHQRPDGSFHGRIYADHLRSTDFYHADWGGALLALDAVHPDRDFRAEVYPGLSRYAEWLLGTRDVEGSGMLDVVDQFETGQEYMSRYQAVDPDADRLGWQNRIRLKGVDVTVYGYRLFRTLEELATAIDPPGVARWRAAAERTARAVRTRMWDPDLEMFFDVDPATGRRTGVKAAVCFYPFLTDLTDASHVGGLARHLFNPAEFWTPFPVPSSSVDDPRFDPDAEWKGKRHNCPWNGRVWPMTNSHVTEALARVVRVHEPEWAPRLSRLLRRSLQMMSSGSATLPNAFEHYHPYNGRPSRYRGIDDYQHSWINDLLVSHVLGVLPHGFTGLTVHPLRLGITDTRVRGLRVGGHDIDVAVSGRGFRVHVDGRHAGAGRVGEPLSVNF
jgi:hypothetical protein